MNRTAIQTRQKFESIGIMTSSVVHEINNLVNIAMNYSDLVVEDRNNPDEIIMHARQISEATERMADLLQILLNYSREDDNSVSLQSMQEIIRRTTAIAHKIMTRNQIDLQKNIADDLPGVNVNRNHIMQILINLLLNAINSLNLRYPEYSNQKMVVIDCSLTEKNGIKFIRTSVTDFGKGLSEQAVKELLAKTDSEEALRNGWGMGLPVSIELASLYKGQITIDSIENERTTFHLDLPTV